MFTTTGVWKETRLCTLRVQRRVQSKWDQVAQSCQLVVATIPGSTQSGHNMAVPRNTTAVLNRRIAQMWTLATRSRGAPNPTPFPINCVSRRQNVPQLPLRRQQVAVGGSVSSLTDLNHFYFARDTCISFIVSRLGSENVVLQATHNFISNTNKQAVRGSTGLPSLDFFSLWSAASISGATGDAKH